MPIYEYVCEACRREFSLLRPMSQADAPAECESCGQTRIKRKLSVFSARSGEGQTLAGTGGGGSCAGCGGGSCASCGHG